VITEQTYPTHASILSAIRFISSGAFQPLHLFYVEKLFAVGWEIFFPSSFGQIVVYDVPHAVFIFMGI